jgi:murein DD-endopeptidase MepM/ murein hydrolase activator NlpD
MLLRFFLLLLIISIPTKVNAYSILDFYSDKSIPIISSDFATDKAYRGKVTVPFVIEDADTAIKNVLVYLDDKGVTELVDFGGGYHKNKFTFDSEGLTDGAHLLTVIAEDSSRHKNKAVQEIAFIVDNTAPLLKLASGKGLFKQGKTAILYFTSSEPSIEVSAIFQSKDLKIYPYGKRYRAVIGFSIDDPGNENYYMKVKARDLAGNASEYHYKVFVSKEKYGTISFVLKPKKVEMLMPDTIRADWKKIEDVVIQENDEKYFSGQFIRPTTGRISMAFGPQEYINGSESGRHRGLDFAAPAGTMVKASNSGIVKLAEYLPAHGNTVVIEHGQGIFTYYAHLKKIIVVNGTKVAKGQPIGLIGATGVATGPHLHFSVSLHNLRVDPMQWLEGVIVD